MNYKEIEPEYLDFIKKQKYGTPIAFANTSLKEEWEAYFAGHEKFQSYCVFGLSHQHLLLDLSLPLRHPQLPHKVQGDQGFRGCRI